MLFEQLFEFVDKRVFKLRHNFSDCDIHSILMEDEFIKDIFEIETPEVEDISSVLKLKKGKVYAVRMDKAYGLIGFKKPVIAALILKGVIESVCRKKISNRWIDAGNVNSCLALAYFANKFKGTATYIVSGIFPDDVINYIYENSNESVNIIKAPDLGLGIERNFYKYLVDVIRNDSEYKNYQPLWHAKYSGEYTTVLGYNLAKKISFCPDYIVAGIGAGSTIEGQAIPIKTNFNNHPLIIVPEHSQSLLLRLNTSPLNLLNKILGDEKRNSEWFRKPPKGIPHSVIGPHYDEINPLIKPNVLSQIHTNFQYDDDDWQQMSYECFSNGLSIGNSSAANLVAAKHLATEGKTVLTFIYEPFRTIYHGIGTQIKNPVSKFANI